MEDKSTFTDLLLVCVDCGAQYIWNKGEQAYYRSKRLSVPRRCPACRAFRRQSLVPDDEVRNG